MSEGELLEYNQSRPELQETEIDVRRTVEPESTPHAVLSDIYRQAHDKYAEQMQRDGLGGAKAAYYAQLLAKGDLEQAKRAIGEGGTLEDLQSEYMRIIDAIGPTYLMDKAKEYKNTKTYR